MKDTAYVAILIIICKRLGITYEDILITYRQLSNEFVGWDVMAVLRYVLNESFNE